LPKGGLRRRVGVTVARARHQGREVQLVEQPVGAGQRQLDLEAPLDHGLYVTSPPRHHAVLLRIRAGQHPGFDLGPLRGVELAPPARAWPVGQRRRAARLLAREPAIQGGAPHPGCPCRVLDRHAGAHVGDRQQADPLARVALHARQGAQLRRLLHPDLLLARVGSEEHISLPLRTRIRHSCS
jgi:hypothetical protein